MVARNRMALARGPGCQQSVVSRLFEHMSPYLRVTRVSSAFAAVANVWFVVLWSRAMLHEPGTQAVLGKPLWLLLLASGCSAVGLYALSACLNDLIDAKRDRAIGRDRPIATGRLSEDAAAQISVLALIVAAGGAVPLGPMAIILTLSVAAGAVVYHIAGRFVPAIGLALAGVIVAGHMMVPNFQLRFLWPVWLVLTHTLLTFGLAHVYGRKVPPISVRAMVAAILGWLLWSGLLLTLGWWRSDDSVQLPLLFGPPAPTSPTRTLWPDWVALEAIVPPVLSMLAFALVLTRKIMAGGVGPRLGEKIVRYGTAWLPLHGVAWMIGVREWSEAGILALLGLTGLFGMTALREAYSLSSHPVGYRR